MATNSGNSRHLSNFEASGGREVLMVGVAAIGSVVLMFLIEKIF